MDHLLDQPLLTLSELSALIAVPSRCRAGGGVGRWRNLLRRRVRSGLHGRPFRTSGTTRRNLLSRRSEQLLPERAGVEPDVLARDQSVSELEHVHQPKSS